MDAGTGLRELIASLPGAAGRAGDGIRTEEKLASGIVDGDCCSSRFRLWCIERDENVSTSFGRHHERVSRILMLCEVTHGLHCHRSGRVVVEVVDPECYGYY